MAELSHGISEAEPFTFDFSQYPRAVNAGVLLPAVIKREPTDFVVDEIPDWQPQPDGQHLYAHFEKTGLTTMDVLKWLETELALAPEQIGHAGMKDKHAVTTQWVSLEGVVQESVSGLTPPEGIRWLAFERGATRIKEGQLRGNRFRIRLRAPDGLTFEPGQLTAIEAKVEELQRVGVPNYYGPQRFGRDRQNARRGLYLLRHGKGRSKRWLDRLCMNSLQSLVFNDWVAARLEAGNLDRVVLGDVAHKHLTFGKFLVDDAERESPRATSLEISASGPMFGRKYHEAQFKAREIEDAVLARRGLSRQDFHPLAGARREGRVPLNDCAVSVSGSDICLAFALPRGAYATAVLRELVTNDCLVGCE